MIYDYPGHTSTRFEVTHIACSDRSLLAGSFADFLVIDFQMNGLVGGHRGGHASRCWWLITQASLKDVRANCFCATFCASHVSVACASSRVPLEDQSMLENFRANVLKKQEIPQMVGLTKEFLIGFLAEPTSREIL